MAKGKVKENIKARIDRLRRKLKHRSEEGRVTMPGVASPKKKEPKHIQNKDHAAPKKRVVSVGPKGGKFVVSTGGKKRYERGSKSQETMVKSVLEELVQETKFSSFINSFKSRKE